MVAQARPSCSSCGIPTRTRGLCPACLESGEILQTFVADQRAGEVPGSIYLAAGRSARRRYRILHADLNAFGPLWHAPRGAEEWENYEDRELRPPQPRYDAAQVGAYVEAHRAGMTRRDVELYCRYWLERQTRPDTCAVMGITLNTFDRLVKRLRHRAKDQNGKSASGS